MRGDAVNELMKAENRAAIDELKDKDTLLVKLHVFDIAFHNLECLNMDQTHVDGNFYKFIPFPCGSFVDLILDAFVILGQDRSKKFLDIGCGMGSKVWLAAPIFDAYGIDYNEDYIRKSNQLGCNRVGLANAFNFDKYHEFDVLYYYRPIEEEKLYLQFEELVHKSMKPGALVAPMHNEYNWESASDMEQMGKFLFRKKT